jgi:hypothetical protein
MSPEGYQRASEENLGGVEDTATGQNALGQSMVGYGASNLGNWGRRAGQMYGMAAGIASREPSWYADRAGVTSNQAFDESKGVMNRTLGRMGINPQSGRYVGLNTQWGLARAASEAAARTRAAQDAEATTFNRQNQLLGAANQGQAFGAGLVNSGAGQVAQSGQVRSGLAGAYGQLAGESAQQRAVEKAQVANASQARIDKMLQEMRANPPIMGKNPSLKSTAMGTYLR